MPETKRRRLSPGPSPRARRNYVASSPIPASRVSPNAHSHLPSRSDVLHRRANVIANTTRPSTLPHYVGPQRHTRSPSPILQPFTRHGVNNSSLVQMTTATSSASQYPADLPSLPSRSDSTQFQQSPPENMGMFYQARDCIVTGTFVDASNVTYNNASSNNFIKDLLEGTIRGAEFDSSDRDPPPRCQPGTRLAILERCIYFISNCNGVQKMRWVVGAAGVGKSAIMQSVAESPDLPGGPPASVFFSINGRNDGTKAIITLSYQLAAKSNTYRKIIEAEITRDPSLLRSSMAKQFNKLIVEPFVNNSELNSANRVLIIIDGLDECKDPRTQLELLRLISDLCLAHPSSRLVWLIASRPEPHITSFFSRRNVIPAYEKEEVPIDSDEACTDVERFLREELAKIKDGSDVLDSRWPEERDFWTVADAAGGLFAYAQTVVNYIGDWRIGSPASQLSDVLHVIDNHEMTGLSREEHPMALLDALYERILSNVPAKIMVNTRKLLLVLALNGDSSVFCSSIYMNFLGLCNWVGLTADEAYAAVNHLRAVLDVPRRDEAHSDKLRSFHKSFIDYISDFSRSGLFPHFVDEVRQLNAECALRVLTEVPTGIQSSYSGLDFACGILANGPVACEKISLTWLVEESGGSVNTATRLNMYKLAIVEVVTGLQRGDSTFRSELCIRFLATAWRFYCIIFPCSELLNAAFDKTRRPEFMAHGILKRVPFHAISVSGLDWQRNVELQFWRPATTVRMLSDVWNSSCQHERNGNLWEEGKACSWKTTFGINNLVFRDAPMGFDCAFCLARFEYQLENWKTDSPDDTALVLFTSTGGCCVEVRLVDPEDGMAEWTYSFWCFLSQDVFEKYRNAI